MGTLPRLALLLALTIAVAASTGLLAAPADAATGVKYGITDDAWLQSGPGTLESRLTQLHTLGVGVVRFTLNWNLIAPVRPAYFCHARVTMTTAVGIFLLVISLVSVIVVFAAFIWAARKDGEEDRALQRKLGIKRRTRMGR